MVSQHLRQSVNVKMKGSNMSVMRRSKCGTEVDTDFEDYSFSNDLRIDCLVEQERLEDEV